MRALAFLLVTAFALAGCSDGGDDGPTVTTTFGQSGTTSAQTTGTGTTTTTTTTTTTGTGGNTPPTVALAASPTSGEAPLEVTFTVEADDADDDALSWSLDADGDGAADAQGDSIPGTYTHTFEEGTYEATVTVDDGSDTVTDSVSILVTPAGMPTTQTVEIAYTVGNAGCGDPPAQAAFGTEADGLVWTEWEVEPGTIGKAYAVQFEGSNPLVEVGGVAFYDADGARIPDSVTAGTSPFTGTVVEGAVYGIFMDCGATANVSGLYIVA